MVSPHQETEFHIRAPPPPELKLLLMSFVHGEVQLASSNIKVKPENLMYAAFQEQDPKKDGAAWLAPGTVVDFSQNLVSCVLDHLTVSRSPFARHQFNGPQIL